MLIILLSVVVTLQGVFGGSDTGQCGFCLEEIKNGFQKFENCTHGSCIECLVEWVNKTMTAAFSDLKYNCFTCPFCRNKLTKKDLTPLVHEMIQNGTYYLQLSTVLGYTIEFGWTDLGDTIVRYFESLPSEKQQQIKQQRQRAKELIASNTERITLRPVRSSHGFLVEVTIEPEQRFGLQFEAPVSSQQILQILPMVRQMLPTNRSDDQMLVIPVSFSSH